MNIDYSLPIENKKYIQQEVMKQNLKDLFKNTRSKSSTNKVTINNGNLSESESYSQKSRHIQGLHKQFESDTKLDSSQTVIIATYWTIKAKMHNINWVWITSQQTLFNINRMRKEKSLQ